MTGVTTDEDFLLTVLNSTPVVAGVPADRFADADATRSWLADLGGTGSDDELGHLVRVRPLLQAIVRGQQPPDVLAAELRDVASAPGIADGHVAWTLTVPPERGLAVRAILAWDQLARQRPVRLRPCANPACRRFLIDHSKPNTARWCSMAICGNRMKARRHYQRTRTDPGA